jgi:hypothetical protein
MDNRVLPRVSNVFEGVAKVRLQPGTWNQVRFSGLGSGGCRFKASQAEAGDLRERTLLQGSTFAYPSLSREAIKAQVVWCRQDSNDIEVGVRFLDIPPAYGEALDQLVASMSRSTTPFSDRTGMPS